MERAPRALALVGTIAGAVTASVASCAAAPKPPPLVSIATAPIAVVVPSSDAAPRSPAPKNESGPFAFQSGKPVDFFGDYAVRYWGPNGKSAFAAPLGRREGEASSEERLLAIGQYAIVELPDLGGFYYRDLGERGWVTELRAKAITSARLDEVVAGYTLRDGDGADDAAKWRATRSTVPEITSVAHMIVEVWSFADPKHPRVLFAHEREAWANCCGSELGPAPPRVSDRIDVTSSEIRIEVRDAWRATSASWKETPLPSIPAALTPWGAIKTRVYKLERGTFVIAEER